MVTPRKLLHVIEAWGRVLKSTTSQFNLQGIFPEAGLNRANYAHVGIYREYSNFPFYEMNARKCIKKQESVILQNPDRREGNQYSVWTSKRINIFPIVAVIVW
jgi:hypothetical protein